MPFFGNKSDRKKKQKNEHLPPETQQLKFIEKKPKPSRSLVPKDFQEISVLGKGAFGQVVLSVFTASGKAYAVKKMTKQRMSGSLDYGHLCDEFEVLKRIDSPFVTKFYGAYLSQQHVHFVLEYVSGGNFSFLLRREIKLEESAVRFYAAELYLGVFYLHSKNIVHRDLKCENLLLTKQGHLKICDFGFARTKMTDTTLDDNFCGTPAMKAKEIVCHERYTRSVDWWCYGIIVFQMAYGSNPLDTGNKDETKQRIREFRMDRYHCDHVPWSVKNLADHLIVDRRERFSARQIKSHFLFSTQYWEDIEAGLIQPPFSGEIVFAAGIFNNVSAECETLENNVEDKRFDKFLHATITDL